MDVREAINEDIKAHGIGHALTSVRDGIQDVSDGFNIPAIVSCWTEIIRSLDQALSGPVQKLEGSTKDYHEYCHPDVCFYRRKQLDEAEERRPRRTPNPQPQTDGELDVVKVEGRVEHCLEPQAETKEDGGYFRMEWVKGTPPL
ncbi:hypothetical protein LCGC14_1665190 [marine sediment metagenome]|uniref:Uncharacterized protein n=1 Tax=marine sediment metagenome TaxID=412755 RepID=A0A0F9IFI8_9ZZZZ